MKILLILTLLVVSGITFADRRSSHKNEVESSYEKDRHSSRDESKDKWVNTTIANDETIAIDIPNVCNFS